MNDPTRSELLTFLADAYPHITCGETVHPDIDSCPDGCGCRFDIEEAAYYIAAHCHGGQWSNLYSLLSTSEFRPGPFTSDLPDYEERSTASDLYRAGLEWIGAPAD